MSPVRKDVFAREKPKLSPSLALPSVAQTEDEIE